METSSPPAATEALKMGLIHRSFNTQYSLWIQEALDELPESFTITDPTMPGHPIVFVSRGFLKMTGYTKEEVLGKNGRVFQGPKTNRRSVMEIREAVREERAVELTLLNYRKNGAPFWMFFRMCPVFGRDDGRVMHFVAVQVPISGRDGGEDWFSGQREMVFGSCRREVCSSDSLVLESSRGLQLDWEARESEGEEACEASESEKRRAAAAMNSVLSVLTHYSELTGRSVCGKRCCLPGAGFLSSSLIISLGRIKQSFVLTNPCLPDMPIVYASDGFIRLTGYDRHEVLGQNCRFLSGADTDCSIRYQIKDSVQHEQSCTVRILNYRKDKSAFWNLLHISPVRSASGKIAYFVGVQVEESYKNGEEKSVRPMMRQLSAVGQVKVAVRSLSK